VNDPRDMTASVMRERAVLAAVVPSRNGRGRPEADPLDELRELVRTAGAVIVDTVVQHRDRPDAGTFIGKGKVQELAERVRLHRADVVIFDNDLSPSQLRNIEESVRCKVIDRSELILDIFATRARTHEAKLQVELAQLEYTYPRLAGMWTHLERIVGGAPAGIGTRGPGEKQIEIDRRIVQRRKSDLKREIERVQARKQREVKARNIDFFTVGIVGYTNAGKSTLFNTLTGAEAYADDKLFATLDTRTRRWDLGGGDAVMLSDTVGFVRDLPHHLVASFRATLEEAVNCDLLLIVLDVSDPHARDHLATVEQVLGDIEADKQPRLVLLNKIDRLEDNSPLLTWGETHPEALAISAVRGLGLDRLVEAVRVSQRGRELHLHLRLPLSEGKALHTLENRAVIHERHYDALHVTLEVTIGSRQLDQLRAGGARFEVVDSPAQAL
jgi:GTPase